jgi:hypothetical protein
MWQEILRDYDRRQGCGCDQQVAWFQRQPSLRAAIEMAARCVDANGRRFRHQSRIRRVAIRESASALLVAEQELAATKSFDGVFAIVREQLRGIAGLGELYRYDTAFRIGSYLRLLPSRVYLHAGTRVGARALGLDYRNDSLDMSELPTPLRHRQPHEVEDILCIYKDRFTSGLRS